MLLYRRDKQKTTCSNSYSSSDEYLSIIHRDVIMTAEKYDQRSSFLSLYNHKKEATTVGDCFEGRLYHNEIA